MFCGHTLVPHIQHSIEVLGKEEEVRPLLKIWNISTGMRQIAATPTVPGTANFAITAALKKSPK